MWYSVERNFKNFDESLIENNMMLWIEKFIIQDLSIKSISYRFVKF